MYRQIKKVNPFLAHISQQQLQRIFTAHHLGMVRDIDLPRRGSINMVMIINDELVVRIDHRLSEGESRFRAEKIAYDALAKTSIPVPEVLVLDTTRTLIPYDYMVMNKLPGTPLIDAWDDLSTNQKQVVAYNAGAYLARLHTISFDHFGELKNLGLKSFGGFYEHVNDYYKRFQHQAQHYDAFSAVHHEQMMTLMESCKPLLNLPKAYLVHSDYQLENLLVHQGEISGVIDFEWAMSGDPTWDFIAEDKWVDQCIGSREMIYAGYRSLRPLDPAHDQKLRLYKALMYIETIAGVDDWRTWALSKLNALLSQTPTV